MNIEAYIESGVLHDYCLGLLSDHERAGVEIMCGQYPQVKTELQSIQNALAQYGAQAATPPAEKLQETVWSTLENINKERHSDLTDLPVINKYSDHNHWKRIVQPLLPKEINSENIQVLRATEQITQVLFISGTAIPDETHEQERESFIVLEGECECCIDGKAIHLGPGGFLEIPLYAHHDVKAITPYVIAIMQRIAV